MPREAGGGRAFIVLAIAIVVALVISPIIFQAISSANSSSKITGTLATIVNLVPLFYYLAVALLAVAEIYVKLRIFKQNVELRFKGGIMRITRWVVLVMAAPVRAFYQGIRPLGA